MARPTTKEELLITADLQFAKLQDLIDSMSDEEQISSFLFEDRDKNLRDIIVHLHEWHNMMEKWYQVGVIEEGAPIVPREGYNWRTLPNMNIEIWKQWQGTDLKTSKDLLKNSHEKMVNFIKQHNNEELFTKNVYKWTKSTTLGAYFVSATSSHYEWAMKKIKKHLKLYRIKAKK